MNSHRFLIIGAGPTGLGAALRLEQLGQDYLVVDALADVGGMAGSVIDERGFTWDLGGHVLHSHFEFFDQAIAASDVPLNTVRRNGWVWMDGRLIRTPIQSNLDELPRDLQPDAPAHNLADYYRNNFEQALFSNFFEPYTFKMWATPLDGIDDAWVSLKSGSGERNVPLIGLAGDFVVKDAYFPYPQGGTGALWHQLQATQLDAGKFLMNTRITDVDLGKRVATLDSGEQVQFEYCVSTAPIVTAMDWAQLSAGRGNLTSSMVYAVGLGFRGEPPEALADKTWLYSPDSDVPWYRATMLSNYDAQNAAEGCWSVLCEISTSKHRPENVTDLAQRTIDSIVRLGARAADLVDVWQRTVPMGYPVPTLGRDAVIRHIDDMLLQHGIYSRGRFGGWRYESCNQDFSFMQGAQAVDHALSGAPEDVFWHPENF